MYRTISENNPQILPANFGKFGGNKRQETGKVTDHHKSNQRPILAIASRQDLPGDRDSGQSSTQVVSQDVFKIKV